MGNRPSCSKVNGDAADTPETLHPNRAFARYIAGYRGSLTRSEAARRSGLPEDLWQTIEETRPPRTAPDLIPAAIVASMCVTVGADVATGLRVAGHRPEQHPHLIERPPLPTSMTRTPGGLTAPYIATPHLISEVLTGESPEVHRKLAAVYRQLAQGNWYVANQLAVEVPDDRAEYWSGYVAAIRAVAEQQAWCADHEEDHGRLFGGGITPVKSK